jgi:putative ABC transport system permease protein
MNSLFGASMDSIMRVMLAMFLVITSVIVVLAVRNRLLFKLGARNLPRRRAQTMLIIFGLMLSTVIVTSAFGTGDTLSYTIRSAYVNGLGNIDETVSPNTANTDNARLQQAVVTTNAYLPASTAVTISATVDPKTVDGVVGVLQQSVPIIDRTSREARSSATAMGVPIDLKWTQMSRPRIEVERGGSVSFLVLQSGEGSRRRRACG